MNNDYFELDDIKSKKLVTNKPEQRYHLVDKTGKSIWNNNKNGYTSREAVYKSYFQYKTPDIYKAHTLSNINEIIEYLCDRDEKEEEATEDNISNPKHYKLDGLDIESIDVVKAVLGEEGFINFCLGNILKYAIRAKKKGQFDSDIGKIKTYCEFIAETKERKTAFVTISEGLKNVIRSVKRTLGID